MRSIAWGTWIATLCASIYLIDQGSFDQEARNLAAAAQVRERTVASSASPVQNTDMSDLNALSKALKKQSHK